MTNAVDKLQQEVCLRDTGVNTDKDLGEEMGKAEFIYIFYLYINHGRK